MTRIATLATSALVLAAAAAAAIVFATGASASGYKSKHLDHAAGHVERRYESGRQSGSITYFEGLRVRRALREYRTLESSYKADGRLSGYERRSLARKLAETRSTVKAASHNGYRRAGVLPRVGR